MNNALTYLDMTFAGRQIKSAQMAVDTSLNGRVLDVDTMSATVTTKIREPLFLTTANHRHFFTRDNLRFMTAAQYATLPTDVVQNEPVRFLRGGSQYALWYLSEIRRIAGDLYTLSMMSSLGRLTQMEHKGGIYNGVAASVIIDDICGVVPHFVGAAFQNVLLYGWLPYVAPSGENGAQTGSAKDNLLKVLFALNATVRDDADGTLRIENLSTAVSAQLDADRIYRDNASVVTEPTVTGVTVLEHQYIAGSETTTLFEGTTVDGQVIVFREPMSNLTATGFTVTESNANYAVVSAGSGTLTGRPYIHTTREITKPVTTAAIPNIVRIENATLVGVTNSADVVNRLADYYSHRTYINVDATIDFEDAGDVVAIFDPFDRVMRQACIEKISPLVVSQVMKGRVSALVGFTPWQVIPFEDVRELLTGSGTWTVPAGVTQVTAVLIGKGAHGESGANGNAGADTPAGGSSRPTIGNGGDGGAGGAGGNGGKILRVAITVTPGEALPYSIDTDSVFGVYSSAFGASSDSGYTDPVTAETLALPGQAGVPGGRGGKPNHTGNGYNAQSVEWLGVTYTGGWTNNETYSHGNRVEYGAGGGGAAAGNNGNDALAAPNRIFNGAAGANAVAPAAATGYGAGGTGGNGGGGGGAAGLDYNANSGWWSSAPGGAGGYGSEGSDGGPGCIILYYRRPLTTQGG